MSFHKNYSISWKPDEFCGITAKCTVEVFSHVQFSSESVLTVKDSIVH